MCRNGGGLTVPSARRGEGDRRADEGEICRGPGDLLAGPGGVRRGVSFFVLKVRLRGYPRTQGPRVVSPCRARSRLPINAARNLGTRERTLQEFSTIPALLPG